jgi:hypothetical protein
MSVGTSSVSRWDVVRVCPVAMYNAPFPISTRPGQSAEMTRTSRTSGTSLHFALFLLVKKLVRVLVRILPAGEMWYEFGLWPFTAALSPDPPDPGQF